MASYLRHGCRPFDRKNRCWFPVLVLELSGQMLPADTAVTRKIDVVGFKGLDTTLTRKKEHGYRSLELSNRCTVRDEVVSDCKNAVKA
eukprot:1219538-Amphidinium_carterae.1